MMTYVVIMRTIIELPEEQVRALDAWREQRGLSRAEAVRRAVAELLASEVHRREAIASTAGIWASRGVDGLLLQEALRSEWDER